MIHSICAISKSKPHSEEKSAYKLSGMIHHTYRSELSSADGRDVAESLDVVHILSVIQRFSSRS